MPDGKFPSLASQWRIAVAKFLTRVGFPKDWFLIPLAAIIGSLAGIAAKGYGALVRFSERFFFEEIGGNNLGISRWWLLIALPAAGGLLVGLIKYFMSLPMISHGIPEVIEALARRHGRLRLRAGLSTAVTSAITLGSGGATGQEGPIVMIGSVIGSTTGQWLRMGREHMGTLIGCGAAAGLAAIFNAPIAGVLLVLEVLLRDFSTRTFIPVVIASVFGVAVNQAISGGAHGALFSLPQEAHAYRFAFSEMPSYLVLGAMCGLVGFLFNRALYKLENLWARIKLPDPVKPISGGVVIGLMGLILVMCFPDAIPAYEPPAFYGNGYPVVETLLDPTAYLSTPQGASTLTLGFLLLVVTFKVMGTSVTLASGGAGGIFAPALFMGASFGAAFGVLLQQMNVYEQVSPATYALAGMAGVLSASVHCPLTAMILVFELTRDYVVIMPVMLVAILATLIAQVAQRDSIYTLALRHMGVAVGSVGDLSILRRLTVDKVPLIPAVEVHPEDPAQRLLELASVNVVHDFIVTDDNGNYCGMVIEEDMRTTLLDREAVPLLVVSELMRTNLPAVHTEETLESALDKFSLSDVASLPVVSSDASRRVLGMITRSRLMRSYNDAINEHDMIA